MWKFARKLLVEHLLVVWLMQQELSSQVIYWLKNCSLSGSNKEQSNLSFDIIQRSVFIYAHNELWQRTNLFPHPPCPRLKYSVNSGAAFATAIAEHIGSKANWIMYLITSLWLSTTFLDIN